MDLPKNRILASAGLLLLLASVPASSIDAADRDKGGFKKVGQKLEQLGREVGEAGKEAGHEIAGAAKHVFYKGKKVSEPLLRDVQHSTREFWAEVVAGKDRTIKELRRENDALRRQLEDEEREDEG